MGREKSNKPVVLLRIGRVKPARESRRRAIPSVAAFLASIPLVSLAAVFGWRMTEVGGFASPNIGPTPSRVETRTTAGATIEPAPVWSTPPLAAMGQRAHAGDDGDLVEAIELDPRGEPVAREGAGSR